MIHSTITSTFPIRSIPISPPSSSLASNLHSLLNPSYSISLDIEISMQSRLNRIAFFLRSRINSYRNSLSNTSGRLDIKSDAKYSSLPKASCLARLNPSSSPTRYRRHQRFLIHVYHRYVFSCHKPSPKKSFLLPFDTDRPREAGLGRHPAYCLSYHAQPIQFVLEVPSLVSSFVAASFVVSKVFCKASSSKLVGS